MDANAVVEELRLLGRESYRKVLLNHGVKEPCFGVKIEELKKIQKRIGKDYRLALDLYDTGNYDAMYLAGLITDDAQMTRENLQHWTERADGGALAGATVPGVAAGTAHGHAMALEWIESDTDFVAVAGWATLSALVSVKADAELELAELRALLDRVRRTIHKAPDDVRYQMNGFVIAVGSYVQPLSARAVATAEEIGRVTVDMGNTACQVPFAPDYIRKVEQKGAIGKKRRTARC